MKIRTSILCILSATGFLWNGAAEQPRPNVLMIAVDDLRPELACYGADQIHSPHIDALAAEGLLFERAYCQIAVCGASRASLLSGTRPETTTIWDYKTPMRSRLPDVLSLPQHLKANGYRTIALGKVYHVATDDFPQGWSERPWRPRAPTYVTETALDQRVRLEDRVRGPSVEDGGRIGDDVYADGVTAAEAARRLQELSEASEPFLLAVGFLKPHLPFVAPGRFWDLYDRDAIEIPDRADPVNSPLYARSSWGELRNYSDVQASGDLDDAQTRELIHGYYASVSYTDHNIGVVLKALEDAGLKDNTIVILWSDHGWYLGEYGDWCKHTNDEVAARVPMILRVPGQEPGLRTTALTELVDVYPTLCDLLDLPVPDHCQGHSFAPLVDDPSQPWKEVAFSQYHKSRFRGTSLRSARYRYTEWRDRRTGELDSIELYDLVADPGQTVSVHEDGKHAAILQRMATLAPRSNSGVAPAIR